MASDSGEMAAVVELQYREPPSGFFFRNSGLRLSPEMMLTCS
jgi:hypothetical protein